MSQQEESDMNIDVVDDLEDNAILENSLAENILENNESNGNTNEPATKKLKSDVKQKLIRLPLARVKHMMLIDPDVKMISRDALVTVTKATEMFIEFLAKETEKQMTNTKRKTIMKKDVLNAIDSISQLCFLEGIFE